MSLNASATELLLPGEAVQVQDIVTQAQGETSLLSLIDLSHPAERSRD